MKGIFPLILLLLLSISCKDDPIALPKPRIYPKVTYPEKSYTDLNIEECPFTMEVPKYFKYIKDKDFAVAAEHQCWHDLYCESLNTYVHMSYVPFSTRAEYDGLISDAFEMADKHNIKASYREEVLISRPESNVYGLIFEIDGPVATPLQFYMTDSLSHFLRGSLYFKAGVNRDSIAPIYAFFKHDINRMIGSFEWR